MDILKTIWSSDCTGNCIGIIIAEDRVTKEQNTYIGICKALNDEADDIDYIINYGAKYPRKVFEQILK
jgi:hypothetical protein